MLLNIGDSDLATGPEHPVSESHPVGPTQKRAKLVLCRSVDTISHQVAGHARYILRDE